MVHMHQKPVSQAKQTSCDKPQTSLTRARILTMCLSPNCLMPESQVYAQNNTSGWWDDRKRNQKPVLPLYLRLDIPSNLSRALSCLRLSGHNFLVQRMRHGRNRRPYELRICDRCDWHTIQDEVILLDCPHEHLVRLRTQQQLIFPPQFEDDPARLRTFMNQPDIFGVASFVAKCLALFP